MKFNTVILIPSYEPESSLVSFVKEIKESGFDILLVNDGSGKEYDEIFNSAAPFTSYIKLEQNRGKGGALKEGFSALLKYYPNAKYVITADGDGQHSLKDLIRINNLLEKENEIIFGSREMEKMPTRSKIGNFLSKYDRTLLTKQYINDDQCGLRGFQIRYLDELVAIDGNRYEYELRQIISFQLKNYKILYMPIDTIYLDNNSKSHFTTVKDSLRLHISIFLYALPALICNALLLASLLVCYQNGFTLYHLIIPILYLVATALYFGVISLLYPSKKPIKRLLNEFLFCALRATFVFLFVFLLSLIPGVSCLVLIPIGMFIATAINYWVALLKYKITK